MRFKHLYALERAIRIGWHRFNCYQSFRVSYRVSAVGCAGSAFSRRMSYRTAMDYKSMFEGREILFDPDDRF